MQNFKSCKVQNKTFQICCNKNTLISITVQNNTNVNLYLQKSKKLMYVRTKIYDENKCKKLVETNTENEEEKTECTGEESKLLKEVINIK